MEDQLISFETAKLAKEKGYNLYSKYSFWEGKLTPHTPGYALENGETSQENYFVHDRCYCPTQSLLQRWLREEKKLILQVCYIYEYDSTPYSYWIYNEGGSKSINEKWEDFSTYEEALEKGLQETLKLI